MTRIEITKKYSSNKHNSAPGEQKVIRYRKLIAQIFELEKIVKKLERDIVSLETELENLDEYVDRSTVVDLIHKIFPSLINKKGKSSSYLFDSFEESDLAKTVREQKTAPYKQ
ncbi:31105_t:CDS:1 [Gigaspora margarita]|uniref:31105_t:CDS:1 n=1 Tax=Gigaspora margarita TaxID=4874 RepID=A0ABN7W4D9_GIGMA|nr:31105_t:CDS:1 [Gigaspora margarita]